MTGATEDTQAGAAFTWSELNTHGAAWQRTATWPALVDRLRTAPEVRSKTACPWLKLATFGDTKTEKGSLRHDANVLTVTGVEGDYDGEAMTPDEAVTLLERAHLRAIVYTSASHEPGKPRWRVLVPCKAPQAPQARAALLARVNGALGGILAGESFTLSQSYYFGPVAGGNYRVLVTFDDPAEGFCVDELDELDNGAIGKAAGAAPGAGNAGDRPAPGDDAFAAAVARLGRKLRTGDGRREMLKAYIASRSGRGLRADDIRPLMAGIAASYFDPADPPSTADVSGILSWAAGRDEAKRAEGQRLAAAISGAAGVEMQAGRKPSPAPAWKLVPIEDLDHAELPPQRWLWEGYIPAGEVTLLAAHGGAGKSTIALMLGVCTVLGLPMFGVPTQAAPVVFYSAEDDSEAVRRALERVIRHLGVSAADLAGRLLVIDATHCAPELVASSWQNDGEGGGRPTFGLTKLGADLRDLVQGADSPPLLIVDNASDTFGGNENARPEVRAFVRQLAGMVRVSGGAALLLAHLDKNSARGLGGGESYSGSTAWHNSVRSRLFLGEDKGGGLVLEHLKSNRGRKREPVHLVWPVGGLPQVDAPVSGFVGAIAANNNTRALLRLVHEFTQRGELLSTATSGPACLTFLLKHAEGYPKRVTPGEVTEALRAAERRGWLERVGYMNRDSKWRERWGVTAAGCEAAGVESPPVPPVPLVRAIGGTSGTGNRPPPVPPVQAVGGVGGIAAEETGGGTIALVGAELT